MHLAVETRGRQFVRPAQAARAHVAAVAVEEKQAGGLQGVQQGQRALAEQRHQAVHQQRVITHIVEHLLQPAQIHQRAGQAVCPPPAGFNARRQQIAEDGLGQLDQALGGGEVDAQQGEMQPLEVLLGFDRGIPAVGAAIFAADLHLAQAPIQLLVDVFNREKGQKGVIVAHIGAPEDLLAQVHLPGARNAVLAGQRLGRDDLVPGVFRAAEDERAGGFQGVVLRPQGAFFGFDGAGGQRGGLPGQGAQRLALGVSESEVAFGDQAGREDQVRGFRHR